MHTVDAQEGGRPLRTAPLARHPVPAWRALVAGAGVLGGQGVACYLHPALGEALAAVDVIVPLVYATGIRLGTASTEAILR
jgi:hypothetical protein